MLIGGPKYDDLPLSLHTSLVPSVSHVVVEIHSPLPLQTPPAVDFKRFINKLVSVTTFSKYSGENRRTLCHLFCAILTLTIDMTKLVS